MYSRLLFFSSLSSLFLSLSHTHTHRLIRAHSFLPFLSCLILTFGLVWNEKNKRENRKRKYKHRYASQLTTAFGKYVSLVFKNYYLYHNETPAHPFLPWSSFDSILSWNEIAPSLYLFLSIPQRGISLLFRRFDWFKDASIYMYIYIGLAGFGLDPRIIIPDDREHRVC